MAKVINTCFFAGGINTLVQTVIGGRMPIVQGGSFAYITPCLAIAAMIKSTMVNSLCCHGRRAGATLPPECRTFVAHVHLKHQQPYFYILGARHAADPQTSIMGGLSPFQFRSAGSSLPCCC